MALKCGRIAQCPCFITQCLGAGQEKLLPAEPVPCTRPKGLPLGTPREVTQLKVCIFGEGFLAVTSFQLQLDQSVKLR